MAPKILPQLKLRKGGKSDVEFLARSGIAMCHETGSEDYPFETVCEGVRNILANSERGFYVVIEQENEPVGSLLCTPCWIDLINGAIWWIHCVYVKPPFRRMGCYSAMYNYVLDEAAKNPIPKSVRLKVLPSNTAAKKAYERLGMVADSDFIYYKSQAL